MAMQLNPRFIRARDAHGYCGMARTLFNDTIRPKITVIPIGKQGIAFDRLEIDAALDEYKQCNGRPAEEGGRTTWVERKHPACPKGTTSGKSTRSSTEDDFAKALDLATSKTPKGT